jgi:hypothetical protein
MAVTPGVSWAELSAAIPLAIIGVLTREFVAWAVSALRAQRSPLRNWFWEICYEPGDSTWAAPLSIELVKLCRRGRAIRGRMYRVYRRTAREDWSFGGELIGDRQLCLTYRSIGKDFGANGVMILGPLTRWLWCGGYHGAPNPERRAELSRMATRVGAVRWLGVGSPEEAHVEWVAVDHDESDPVRRFLATIPDDNPLSPAAISAQLPRRARRVLLEAQPKSLGERVRRFLARPIPVNPVRHRLYQPREVKPGHWSSPSRAILIGEVDERDAA